VPERVKRRFTGVLRVGAALVIIAFCAWFTYEAFGWMDQSRRLHSKSEQADFLLWPWMAVIPVTMAFVTVIAVFRLLRADRAGAVPQAGAPLPLGDGL
jgi:TRAP-type C4-dicarboxylate transport system permease small subunit